MQFLKDSKSKYCE